MKTIETLYNLLQVNRKIEDHYIRYMYLKDVWGLEQIVIGKLEGVSQSQVSKEILVARKNISPSNFKLVTKDLWSPEEIHYIHMLPREILPDIVAIAFINNILGVHPVHGFFDYMDTTVNARIAALAWLGVMNKRLVELFHKNQPTISMIVKRNMDRIITIQRVARYEQANDYKLKESSLEPYSITKFDLAGGHI